MLAAEPAPNSVALALMCGRFAITLPPDAMRHLFAYEERPNFPARYNIAPTQPIPIVRASAGHNAAQRHFALVRWGFLPGFVKDPKTFPLIFNARSEGITGRASFRNAVRRRRCLIPADAFYEWRRTGTGKAASSTPYMARRADGQPMGLAGIWETWIGPNGEEVDTACIVTTGANDVSAAIHPRLPVLIEAADFETWLDPDETATDSAMVLLRPPENDILTFVPIGAAVNKADRDGPEIQIPAGPALTHVAAALPLEPRQASLF